MVVTYYFINLLPVISKTGIIGIILTTTLVIFLLNYLYHTVKNKKILKKANFYNILLITLPIYMTIFYTKIQSVKTTSSLNIKYCETNFLILTIILGTIIVSSKTLIYKNKNSKK